MNDSPRRLPSLNALRAFEAAARHRSFTKAAGELSVTQGAVSHQVKSLETELGITLFHRFHKGLELTTAGQTYLPTVRDAFDRLAFGTKQLQATERINRLTISVSPNFASKWLVPRHGSFIEQHPELDLRISANPEHIDFALADVDIAVRHGTGDWPDLHVTKLAEEELFPVVSPYLIEQGMRLEEPDDLRHCTLLHLDNRENWRQWLDVAGVTGVDLSRGVVFDQANMAIEAAIDGQGVALARTTLAAHDLQAGRLLRPFRICLARDYGYFIVNPKPFAERPKIKVMRTWLLQEAAADRKHLSDMFGA